MEFMFNSLEQMAEHFAAKARSIRSRIDSASPQAKRIMQSEAHAYEQAAFVVSNAKIGSEK